MGDFTDAQLNGDRFADSSLNHPADFGPPPLEPTETPAAADILLRQEAFDPTPGSEHLFQFPDRSDLGEIEKSFGSRRKVIAGTAFAAALGVAALAYFFLTSAGEKAPPQTAESAPAVQSSAVAPVQVAPRIIPEPSPATPNVVAWPDLPPSLPVEASPQVAPAENTAARQAVPPWENRDIVFLQRPGVNIRSTPSANGTVLGTARKGMRFEVTNREANWVQVESGRLKGWINSQFLTPNEPR
jgi:hypothetical protein